MESKKPKIGLITLSIEQKISPINPKSRLIISQYADEAEKVIKKENLVVFRVKDFIENRQMASKISYQLIKEKIDCVIMQIGVWPSPSLMFDIIENLNPYMSIILWAIDDLEVKSFVPACQFHGALDDVAISHEFIYANPNESDFINRIKNIAHASHAVRRLRGMNLGLFGGRYMNMYTGTADPIQVKKVFGVEIKHINEFCLVKEAEKINNSSIKQFAKKLREKYKKITVPKDVEEKSIRLYFAMEKLKKENDLDFAAVKCMLEVQGDYCSHCLSVSQHIDKGFIISCEADINGAITMQILKLLSNQAAGFGDIIRLDKINNMLTVVNCGAFAATLADKPDDVTFAEQRKDLVPGDGSGMTTAFICKSGKVTLGRLGRQNGQYCMQIANGVAKKFPEEKRINKHGPHLFVKLDNHDFNTFVQNCRSNHLHWVYGEYQEQLLNVCKILGIKPFVC